MQSYKYIFETPKDIDYDLFRQKYLEHNRERSMMLAMGALTIFIVLNLIWKLFSVPSDFPQASYFATNLRILAISSIIVIGYNYLYKRVKVFQHELVNQLVIIVYALCILSLSCVNSFVISLNPRNNLTPILIGAIVTSTLFRFSVWESLFLYISGLVFFASLFFIWPDSRSNFAINISVVFNIYLMAFIINRSILANAYRLFKQIRLTESINTTLKNTIKQKDDVLEIVVHDLRGPIANIKEMSWQIEHSDNKDVEYTTYLPLIQESCINAEMVIHDLISIAKIKNIEEPLNAVCINDLSESVVNFIRSTNPNRKIIFTSSTKKYYSTLYPDKLKRILLNLLGNALKFTPEDKKIEIAVYKSDSNHVIDVIDEGIGIEESLRSHLFDKFSKASKTGLKGEESVGLGLYIVKELTELMDGTIEYVPNASGGSIFRLKFPKHK